MKKVSTILGIVINLIFLILSTIAIIVMMYDVSPNIIKWDIDFILVLFGLFFSSIIGLIFFLRINKKEKLDKESASVKESILDARLDNNPQLNKYNSQISSFWVYLAGICQMAISSYSLFIIHWSALTAPNLFQQNISTIFIGACIMYSSVSMLYLSIKKTKIS